LRGETESEVRISRFPVEDVVSDESLKEDSSNLPSIASQTVLVNRLREILEREKRGNVTEEVDGDGTRMSVRTRDEGRIEEAELALDAANGLLMNLMSLKNLTEHVMDSGPEGAITVKKDIEKLKQEASDAMTKQESLISDSKSLVKLSPKHLENKLRALGEQAKDTMKAIGREREAEKAAEYADEAYREAKEELRERAEKERLEEEEKAAEKAELSSKMSESENKIRDIQNENAAMRETVQEKKASVMAKKNELKELAKQSEDLEKTLSEMKGDDE
jgi:chromosome segregation ATPase